MNLVLFLSFSLLDNVEKIQEEMSRSWDSQYQNYLDQRLWSTFNNKKTFIRRNIFYNKNISSCYNDDDDDDDYVENDVIFQPCHKYVDDFLTINTSSESLSFKNIAKNKEESESDSESEYLNTENFKHHYPILMKTICAIANLSYNILYLTLCDIFNICNVVAFDLKQDILVIIQNYQIYIIFYKRNNDYIKLDLSKRKLDDDDDDYDDDKHYSLHEEIKEFINQSNMNHIYNYYTFDDKKFSILRLPPISLISSSSTPILIKNDQEWSNWDSPKTPYIQWHINKETKTCTRRCVHFRFSLADIYNNNNSNSSSSSSNDSYKIKNYSIQNVYQNVLNFNYLYIHHEALICSNVIHIDFKNYYFIILNVREKNTCEFKAINFSPVSYNGHDNNNNLAIPFTNFIIKVSFDKLNYHEFMTFVESQ